MSEALKTMDIKGKPYVLVNERIKAFRKKYSCWSMETNIIELTGERCVMQAVIKDDNGVVKATGTAEEKANSTYINKTSYVENCETSAWGRALGNLGIGIDTSIASAEEVQNAVNNQDEVPFPEADREISDKEVLLLERLFSAEPDGGVILKKLLLKGRDIKKLTKREFGEIKAEYAKLKKNSEDKAFVTEKLKKGTTILAEKANMQYDNAKQMIEDCLEIDFNKVERKDIPKVCKQIQAMINDLGDGDAAVNN